MYKYFGIHQFSFILLSASLFFSSLSLSLTAILITDAIFICSRFTTADRLSHKIGMGLAQKPTQFRTTSFDIATGLDLRCGTRQQIRVSSVQALIVPDP